MNARRKFAVNSKVWSGDFNSHFSEILGKAREFGFEGIEIPVDAVEIDRSSLMRLLRGASESGERRLVPIITASGKENADPSSLDPEIRRRGVERIKTCVDLCSDLSGSLVCGPLYTVVGSMRFISDDERRIQLAAIADSFRQASDYAKLRSVKLALEPLCRYDTQIINTVAQSMELIDMIGRDNVGLLLDTFHLNIEEKSLRHAILSSRSKLFHFHACENDRGTPGSGSIPWNSVAEALNEIDYSEMISIEAFTPFEKDFSSTMRAWRGLTPSQDDIAKEGLIFLKGLLS